MENEIQPINSSIQPPPQTPLVVPPSTNWSKIMLFTVLGLIIVVGSIFIGIQIGKSQTLSQQPSVVQSIPSPTQTTVPTAEPNANPTTNPTADWKTYSNSINKYSVEYPTLWKTSIGDNGLTTNFTQTASPDFISITVQDNPSSIEIHQWLIDKSIVPNPNNITTHIQEEDISVSGIKSVKVTTPINGGQFSIYLPKGNKVYSIYNSIDPSTQSSQENFDQNLTIMNKMVSTFKFTN